ncbi:MIOREX complex component 10 [Spathaspora sp. JA1]|nr:MIOREX complex component 10 [Spathaspora sp. JA1]
MVVPEEVLSIDDGDKHLMVLSNGTLVGWNLSEDEIIHSYVPILEGAIDSRYEKFESEELDWIELKTLPENPLNKGNSYLHGEIMVIQGSTFEKRLLDMAAFAVGISRSTRLSILEDQLEEHLTLAKQNSEILAMGKLPATTEHEFLKLTGRLFLLRGKLNLYSELIDTPDLYWSEPVLEKIYESVSKILDVNSRISILNRKLDYATDEQRAFLAVLNERKSTRLEWIIIWLILVEVCFETFHFYERYLDKKVKKDEN